MEAPKSGGGEGAKAGVRIAAVVALLISMGAELAPGQHSSIASAHRGTASAPDGPSETAGDDDFDDFEEAAEELHPIADKSESAQEAEADVDPAYLQSSAAPEEVAGAESGDLPGESAQGGTLAGDAASEQDAASGEASGQRRSLDVERIQQQNGTAGSSGNAGTSGADGRRASIDSAAWERCLKVCPPFIRHAMLLCLTVTGLP